MALRRRGVPGWRRDVPRATMEIGEKSAEVLVTGAVFDEEGKVNDRPRALTPGA